MLDEAFDVIHQDDDKSGEDFEEIEVEIKDDYIEVKAAMKPGLKVVFPPPSSSTVENTRKVGCCGVDEIFWVV